MQDLHPNRLSSSHGLHKVFAIRLGLGTKSSRADLGEYYGLD